MSIASSSALWDLETLRNLSTLYYMSYTTLASIRNAVARNLPIHYSFFQINLSHYTHCRGFRVSIEKFYRMSQVLPVHEPPVGWVFAKPPAGGYRLHFLDLEDGKD